MRRLFLLAALTATLTASAEQATVSLADGTAQTYTIDVISDITFSADGSQLLIHAADGITVTYPVAALAAIDFSHSEATGITPYDTAFDVTFDASDETTYTSVTEKVPTKDTDPDYGDFVENYEDDEESKGTVTITYNGATASIAYNPTSLKNKAVLVQSGTSSDVVIYGNKKVDYVVKGTSSDGSLTIYAAKKCRLTLSGLSLKSTDGPAITLPQTTLGTTQYGGKTIYLELTGTNSLEDGTYTPDGTVGKAALFAEGQLIFSGKGSLTVTAHSGHGIASDDYIRLRGGSNSPVITITTAADKDGISVNDYFLMYGGTLTIHAADDGISVAKGYADIAGGTLTIHATDEGIVTDNEEAAADVNPSISLRGGRTDITTTADKGHALKAASTYTQTDGLLLAHVSGAGAKALNTTGAVTLSGGTLTALVDGLPIYDEEEQDVSSAAAIRCRGTLSIDGATLSLKATAAGGKGINSAGPIVMTSGTATIVTAHDRYTSGSQSSSARGITADSGLTVSGGSLRIRSIDDALYTPTTVTLNGGTLHALSTNAVSLNASTVTLTGGWLVTK